MSEPMKEKEDGGGQRHFISAMEKKTDIKVDRRKKRERKTSLQCKLLYTCLFAA